MKPALTVEEQLTLLKSRNLIFEREDEADNTLSLNNYYRLSGYWRNFQIDPKNGNNDFKEGVKFEKILEIYNLDFQLRNLLLKGIGIFEVSFRSKLSYYIAHSQEQGMYSYLTAETYTDKVSKGEKVEDLLFKINKELEISKEISIAHYRAKKETVPIWAAVEVLGFGTISKMFSRWKNRDVVKNVYRDFEFFRLLREYDNIFTTLRALTQLRNLCAHQARIWNKKVITTVVDKDYLKKFGESEPRAQWRVISALMWLVDGVKSNNEYSKELLNLCKSNDDFYKGLIEPNL